MYFIQFQILERRQLDCHVAIAVGELGGNLHDIDEHPMEDMPCIAFSNRIYTQNGSYLPFCRNIHIS